ncbi:CCAAT-box DNA binding subunit B, putative [Babesia caballi]|uniref:CCAAT-box DNA binding subunit B, putative n=1 Tax=Babesia caballi TaxID=5871 RepID=A0AAV4LYI0_BABCB|nr:CCAAT-box DNA binding subunit B, putative [Babesia caballi]
MIRDSYHLDQLVVGDGTAAVGLSQATYAEMTQTPYRQDVVGMEPSYLANWDGAGRWADPATPKASEESYAAMSNTQYDMTGDYACYGQTQYQPQEHTTPATPCAAHYGDATYDPQSYNIGAYKHGKNGMSNYDACLPTLSTVYEPVNSGSSFDSTKTQLCASYEAPAMVSQGAGGAMGEAPLVEPCGPHQMVPLSDYPPAHGELMSAVAPGYIPSLPAPHFAGSPMSQFVGSPTSHFVSSPTPQHRGSPMSQFGGSPTSQYVHAPTLLVEGQGPIVSTEELFSFTSHCEDICKTMKRKLGSPMRMLMDPLEVQKQAALRRLLRQNELSSSVSTTPTSKGNSGGYEPRAKRAATAKSVSFGRSDQGYGDASYLSGQAPVGTSTPTMRPRMVQRRRSGFGDMAAELSAYKSDPYRMGEVETANGRCVDSGMVYQVPSSATGDSYQIPLADAGVVELYPAGRLDNPLESSLALSAHVPQPEVGQGQVQPDAYAEHAEADRNGGEYVVEGEVAEGDGVEAAAEQSPYLVSSVLTAARHDHGGIDGVDHFGGIVETFKDEDFFGPDMDAQAIREAVAYNRYIGDLGKQYDMARGDGSPEETCVYLRTPVLGDFGHVGLNKEKVVAAPTATSGDLYELLASCGEAANYQPTVDWDEGQQGYVVTWWEGDARASTKTRQARAFPATANGKSAAYDEALKFSKQAETQIRPGALIRWYPGFNIPIGTSGRTNLRKVLHMDRMRNSDHCDPVLAANGMKIATKSTFGDMTIVELYKAAYVLGLWDVAAYNCLKTCKRRGYSYRWIHQLQLMNRRVTLDALKYLRNVRETLTMQRQPKRSVRPSPKRASN